jgi:PhzF family phenazine biosynthesis protein
MTAKALRYAAFTHGRMGGTPAGVVLDADGLSEREMQRIAAELGYPRSAFLVGSKAPGARAVRYFSPRAEYAFCGHATVALAVALAERGEPGEMLMKTGAGTVRVTTRPTEAGLAATLTSIPTRTSPATDEQVAATLRALRWRRDDLDAQYPAHIAHSGKDHLFLFAATRRRLAARHEDIAAIRTLMRRQAWATIHLFWAETRTRFHARNPVPRDGIADDLGAAAAFGGYLRDLRLVPLPRRVIVLHGHDTGTPSRVLIDLAADRTSVHVSGTAAELRPAQAEVSTGHVCALCRRPVDALADGDPPVTGSSDVIDTIGGPQTRWICDSCTRQYIRSIEGKLDLQWWGD